MLVVFAAGVTTVDVAQAMAAYAFQGRPALDALGLWGLGFVEWLFRGLLIPIGVAASRRFPLDAPGHRARNAAVHVVIGVVLPPLLIAGSIPVMVPQIRGFVPTGMAWGWVVFWRTELTLLSRYLLPTMALYVVVVGVHHALTWQRRLQQAENREERLQGMLDATRLSALRAQIRPHFLFNTLNAITVMARNGQGQKVAETATYLAEMLRLSLDSEEQLVSLREELRLVDAYLRIETVRFEDRLGVIRDIDHDADGLLVPAFLLQPLVENAVRHGVSGRRGRTTVNLGARRLDQRLHLWVEDDGPGAESAPAPGGRGRPPRRGIGLGHTRERLAHLFGEDQSLRVRTAPGRGFRVDILIPLIEGDRDAGSAA